MSVPIVEILGYTLPSSNAPAESQTGTEQYRTLDFDDTTVETAYFKCRLHPAYAGNGVTFKISWGPLSGTPAGTETVQWEMAIRRLQPGTTGEDRDSGHTYDYNTVVSTSPDAIGEAVEATIAFADGVDMDSLSAGEEFILAVRRNPAGTDNLVGDAALYEFIEGVSDPYTDEAILRGDTTGAGVQDSGITISDADVMTFQNTAILGDAVSAWNVVLSADTNDWNPTSFHINRLIKISITSGDHTVTGLDAPDAGENRWHFFANDDLVDSVTFTHEDANSLAANRFLCPNGSSVTLRPDETMVAVYDEDDSRWRLLPTVDADLSGPGTTVTDNALVRWDGATGRLVQNSGAILDDTDSLTGLADITSTQGTIGGISLIANDITGVDDIEMPSGDLRGNRMNAITPSALAAQANDYDPTNFGLAHVLRQDLTGSQTITGFAAPAGSDNRFVYVTNIDAGADVLTLAHESASSATANRIVTHTGGDITLDPGESAFLSYDDTQTRWVVLSLATAAGAGDVTAASTIADNALVRGDGGAKGIQGSGITISDTDNVTGVGTLTIGGQLDVGTNPVIGVTNLTLSGQINMSGGDIDGVDDILMSSGSVRGWAPNVQSPTALAAQADNYDPTNFGIADVLRITLTGDQTITGFAAPVGQDNQWIYVKNADATDTLTLAHESGSSTSTNRIRCPNAASLALAPGEAAKIAYNATDQRWEVVAVSLDVASLVTGPASATDNAIARYDATTGKLIQDSGVTVDDNNDVDGVRRLQADESITFDAETDNGNSGAADTIDWNTGNHQKSTLTADCTYTFTAPNGVGVFTLRIIQNATGGWAITWPATVDWPGGTAPDFSTLTSNQYTIVSFRYDGTNWQGLASLDGSGNPQAFS